MSGEVQRQVIHRGNGKASCDCLLLNPERVAIPVDRVDDTLGTEQIGKRERKRAATGAEIGPGRRARLHCAAQQPDMIVVVYDGKTGNGKSDNLHSAYRGIGSFNVYPKLDLSHRLCRLDGP